MRCRRLLTVCRQRQQALSNTMQRQKIKECLECGKNFTQIIQKVEFCSPECEEKFFDTEEYNEPSEYDEWQDYDSAC